jgi:integrase/recombinase XerD
VYGSPSNQPCSRRKLILQLPTRNEDFEIDPKRQSREETQALRAPKSGKERKFVFIPQKVADRLKDYMREKGIPPHSRIFPICYEAARALVRKEGNKVGIRLRPHDLRRHAATHASRSGVPVEIVSKVILRHATCPRHKGTLGR